MYILCDELVYVGKSALRIDGLMGVLASYRLEFCRLIDGWKYISLAFNATIF